MMYDIVLGKIKIIRCDSVSKFYFWFVCVLLFVLVDEFYFFFVILKWNFGWYGLICRSNNLVEE